MGYEIPRRHENSLLPKKVRFWGPYILFWLFAPLLHLLLKRWGKVPAHGLDNLRKASLIAKKRRVGILFVANHASEVDPFVVGTSMLWKYPFIPCYAVSRVKDRYRNYGRVSILFGGRLFWSFGTYPVLQGLRNYQKSVPFHEEVLRDGRTALIFIEGGILDKPLTVAKGGAGYLACATGAVVVPVALCGTAHMTGKVLFSGKRKMFASFGKPIIAIDQISDSHHNPLVCKDISAKILKEIREILIKEGYAKEKPDGEYEYVLP